LSADCSQHDHDHQHLSAADSPRYRRVLWVALALNAAMFAIEIGAGLASGSVSLLADAIDFFGDAANYYRTQSAIRFLGKIRVPALLIQAQDDTFIPFSIYDSEELHRNPHIRLLITRHGGHLGFLARAPRRFWLDYAIMQFICDIFVKNQTFQSSEV